MKIGYYPGCSLEGTAREYNDSFLKLCNFFNIKLEEISQWNCCGATAGHSFSKLLSLALPANVIVLAEQQGFEEIVIPCAACYNRIISTIQELKENEKLRNNIENIIEKEIQFISKPISILDFISKYIEPLIDNNVKNELNLKVACYYGCLLTRPPKLVNIEKYENPFIMEQMVKKVGAQTIDWAYKTECCGASLSVSKTDIVGKLSGKILDDAISRGAEAIVVACPMCQSNLDMRRKAIENYLGKEIRIPILYITQVIGLALGFDEKQLGLNRHFVPFISKRNKENIKENTQVMEV